jgi:hypothetical protein
MYKDLINITFPIEGEKTVLPFLLALITRELKFEVLRLRETFPDVVIRKEERSIRQN